MEKIPPPSGRQVVKALSNAGFEIVGRKGSHVRLKKKTSTKTKSKKNYIFGFHHYLIELD
jgi:predicted RNA binding protein YcfA (HicA-like mRNA interferase family)